MDTYKKWAKKEVTICKGSEYICIFTHLVDTHSEVRVYD